MEISMKKLRSLIQMAPKITDACFNDKSYVVISCERDYMPIIGERIDYLVEGAFISIEEAEEFREKRIHEDKGSPRKAYFVIGGDLDFINLLELLSDKIEFYEDY